MRFNRIRIERACAVAVLLAAAALVLPSQSAAPARSGIYAGGGFGYGWGRTVKCIGCPEFSPHGTTAYLEFGFTLSPHLLLGAEADWAAQNPYDRPLRSEFYLATATYYPSSTQGYWIEGAAGYGSGPSLIVVYDSVAQETSTVTFPHSGFAMGLGIGYDIDPRSGPWRIVPFAKFLDQFTGSDGAGPLLLQFGVGLAYKH